MIWLVEESLVGSENMVRLGTALKLRGSDMYWVSTRDGIRLFDYDHVPDDMGIIKLDEALETGVVISYGTHEFVRYMDKYSGGRIKTVSDSIRMDSLTRILGNRMLNDDVTIGLLNEVGIEDRVFIRPVANSKWFDGCVIQVSDLSNFVRQLGERVRYEEVLISTYKEIEEEYRFFVVGRNVVTGSLYKKRGIRCVSDRVDTGMMGFVREVALMIDIEGAYTLDVACVAIDNREEWKVIECNNFNTSGLYACDEGKIVEGIEKFFRRN